MTCERCKQELALGPTCVLPHVKFTGIAGDPRVCEKCVLEVLTGRSHHYDWKDEWWSEIVKWGEA